MEIGEAIYFKSNQQFRKWLTKNHAKRKEQWLGFYKKHTEKLGIQYEKAVDEATCFGWIDGKLRRVDDEKHIIRFSPRKAKSVWSKINKERAERLINGGKMTAAGFASIEEAKKSGSWEKAYTNIKRERMRPDLKKALTKNKKAWDNFQNFANSYRNMYIGWVANAKTKETRLKRIKEVVKRTEQNKKPGIE